MTDELPEKFPLTSMDVAAEKRDELRRVLATTFPEAVAEGKIDLDQLKRVLGEWVEPDRERFGLNWPGKAACMKVIQAPSVGTLKPVQKESVDWDTTQNLFIEGDNLEVLKLLQKAYFGKIKMIYIDPPYNTGGEFIYPDRFAENLDTYLTYTGQINDEGRRFSTNTESSGRFHTRWLNMMFPRIYLAKNLLREDGAIFISIGQDEVSNLLAVCKDVFGEENLVTICSRVMKTGGQKGVHFSPSVDYIIVMAKNIAELAPFREQISQNLIDKVYTKIAKDGPRVGKRYRSMGLYQAMLDQRANQRFYIECPDGQLVLPPGDSFPEAAAEGEQIKPGDGDGVWRWTYRRFAEEKREGNIEFLRSDKTSLITVDGSPASWNVYYKIWLDDRLEDGQLPGNILEKFESRHSSAELKALNIPFDFAKPSALIKYLMEIGGVREGDITLDFFAGSGSTGHAAMELSKETGKNRPFICVQLPEPTGEDSEERKAGFLNISSIARERLKRAAKSLSGRLVGHDVDLGFRAFELSASNFQIWNGDVEGLLPDDVSALQHRLDLHVEHVDLSVAKYDILYELILKDGFPLGTKVECLELAGKEVFSLAEGALLICLADTLSEEVIDAMADLEPSRVICLDAGFQGNDQLKANAVQTFKARARSRETAIEFRTV
ncbi:site-specific DNA-methyltransferase [Phenylobacterium sp.]|uniref:site-specific DNA-methyltransferase n=1 Tax=Phenylobacterium sp. TaxID=1871053 RepID=UPI0025E905AE|nr:site-specific DNA-methyltransferase [Phenylobacterium sp.]MCA6309773.1 site-specific DNA-methyltransferase [Phenylobacterium sp.]MCA6323498.1 site-specific DNA-methyltransferase [Phenylobacterium sp.]MCA6336117.1 site-specific DNA-methyltransferase [Phenylobacterium sp.]MCA6338862.1 site-specific DNA-methyltransferase [Phenylobacterium sp.]MCA6345145.1 site-specific DNA-methyltransferase [Phenylobacterium sp.]